jgi:hypothetical protein
MTMADKNDLCEWVVEALRANNGQGRIVDICKYIWNEYEQELRRSGDLFYTWQYDMRWTGQKLRNEGILIPASSRTAPWRLSSN